MYKLIVWDFDGTLSDSSDGLLQAHEYIINQFKLPQKTAVEMLKFIGPLPKDTYHNVFGLNESDAMCAHNMFREYYLNNSLLNAKLYNGIKDILVYIHANNIMHAIASNKRQDCLEKLVDHFGIRPFFKYIYGQKDNKLTTKSEMINKFIFDEHLKKDEVCMIGDTVGDKNTATEVGIDFIGVNYGFGFHEVPEYANTPVGILEKLKI